MTNQEQKYLDLIPILADNHFMAGKLVEFKKGKEVLTGLWINCFSILKDEKLARVREAIGDNFLADYFPNKGVIEIRAVDPKKKKGTLAAS